MSPRDVEIELKRWRAPDDDIAPSTAQRLSVDDAISYRNAGNLPDELGRTLRLVLHVRDASELSYLQEKRLAYEPDFHAAPDWRVDGSKPVNVVPLRDPQVIGTKRGAWWDDPDVAALEHAWSQTGRVEGLPVPAEYRSFVYKTVLSLRRAGRDITADSVADSIARWLSPKETEHIRAALKQDQRVVRPRHG